MDCQEWYLFGSDSTLLRVFRPSLRVGILLLLEYPWTSDWRPCYRENLSAVSHAWLPSSYIKLSQADVQMRSGSSVQNCSPVTFTPCQPEQLRIRKAAIDGGWQEASMMQERILVRISKLTKGGGSAHMGQFTFPYRTAANPCRACHRILLAPKG